MEYLLGASIGGLAAFAIAIPALIMEISNRKPGVNLPLFVDLKTLWGRELSHTELFLVALLTHIILGALFGLIYPVFVINEWLYVTNSPYTFLSLQVYGAHVWLVAMTIIFPVLGFGLFGKNEGKLVWLEVLISFVLIGVIMGLVVHWFQPYYFAINV